MTLALLLNSAFQLVCGDPLWTCCDASFARVGGADAQPPVGATRKWSCSPDSRGISLGFRTKVIAGPIYWQCVQKSVSLCVCVCESACALHSCTVRTSLQALVSDTPPLSRWLKLRHKTELHLSMDMSLLAGLAWHLL